ncbi:MAG: histidine phosphatase family protein [Bauldia sp.]
MLRLFLLRHAKAEPAVGGNDPARPLTAGGTKQARAVGAKLAAAFGRPDLVLVSPARRTRETLAALSEAITPPPDAISEDDLYSGDADDYRRIVAEHGGSNRSLLVVGHNPAIHEFAIGMATPGDAPKLAKFPVGTLAALSFPVEAWRDLQPRSGALSALMLTDPD